jgi:putative copper resistance protein D
MDQNGLLIGARAVHFAAILLTAGVTLFVVLVAAPALRLDRGAAAARLWARLAGLAWSALALAVISGAAWFVLTAQSMSGEAWPDIWTDGVLWTVLTETVFGNDWLLRLAAAGVLAGLLVRLFVPPARTPFWIGAAALLVAAILAGSLAWAGHAIGANGAEGTIHPVADVLHLIAAAAWLGALPPLVLLLGADGEGAVGIAAARDATLRFSTIGLVSVGTLLVTGIANSWYLVGGIDELLHTPYGQLVVAKIALFALMVAVAAINRLKLTPRLLSGTRGEAHRARSQLRSNATVETGLGAAVIAIVALLGTLPPASHAHHHPVYGAVPAGAAFVHIHSSQAMADVTVTPAPDKAQITMRLWTGDFAPLDARGVAVTLTGPAGGAITRAAAIDADGAWQVKDAGSLAPGTWTIAVDITFPSGAHVLLDAPILIEAAP